jgi:arylsulfatase A-like enzyme
LSVTKEDKEKTMADKKPNILFMMSDDIGWSRSEFQRRSKDRPLRIRGIFRASK